jgi:hypothetical protein
MTEQIKPFKDNAPKPIIAFDFDGTVTMENVYPDFAPLRPFIREVTNVLHELGAVVIIWTCRDIVGKNPLYDDISPMRTFLRDNGVYFDAINTSYQYAPFFYDSRKIFAHMYVDDKAFGWSRYDPDIVLLVVLGEFLINIMDVPPPMAHQLRINIREGDKLGQEANLNAIKDYLQRRRV